MNIALFSDSYFPTKSGIVTVVSQLREQFKKAGHRVILVTVATSIEYEESDPDLYRIRSFPLGLGTDQYFGLPNMVELISFLRKQHIDIIHCHTEFNVGHAALRVGRILKIPVICTTHTMWEDFYKYYLPFAKFIPVDFVRLWMKHFYRKFTALVNVSTKARNYFKQDFMLPNLPSAVIPNAIDKSKFQAERLCEEAKMEVKKQYGITADEGVLLFVGRIAEEKRVFELLQVCCNALEKTTRYKAIFVGNGPALDQMKERASKDKMNERLIFTGYIDWKQVHRFYDIADIFMTASLSEMHSMTVLEASLSSLPIVVRNDESYLDTIIQGQNGYVADSDTQMTEYLVELMQNPDKCRAFGERSLLIAREFSIESHIAKTLSFYHAVLDAWPERPPEEKLRDAVSSGLNK